MIEIVVVLALFSILLSIAAPKVNIFNSIKEKQELRAFKSDILHARNRAIVESKKYTVYLNYENNSYDISYNVSNTKSVIIKEYKFQYGIKFVRNPRLKAIEFTSSGTVSIADTLTIVDSKNNIYELSIGVNTGKITLRSINWG